MPAFTRESSPQPLLQAYAKADASLRLHQAKLCSVISLVLVPLCIGLDYFAYPHMLRQIMIGRLLCDAALLPCYLALFTGWGRRHVHILGSAPPLLPCITICWMIYATEGVLSPYYAGLNIVLVGVILLIPYTLSEAACICGIVIFCYSLACLLHLPPENLAASPAAAHGVTSVEHTMPGIPSGSSSFFNNVYFLGMTTVIALCGCRYNSRRRFQEFSLRYELDANNRELAATLTKLQETEVQLVQSEKMNALGKLSAGLLHEINNPLNFTFMALQVAQGESTNSSELNDTLKDIGEGMERIRTVISDLRAFAYPSGQVDTQEFAVEEALTSARRLVAHELGHIPVDATALAGVRALGAHTQIVHVFMNLLVNSVHALKEKSADQPSPAIVITAQHAGNRVAIGVRDNGVGVPPANLKRCLDPFFTTKEPGQGLGLGLSICHTIVKNHGGSLHINSEPGQWTQVTFDLPLALPAARSAA